MTGVKENWVILEAGIRVLSMSGKSMRFRGGCRFVTDEKWVLSEVMLKRERDEERGLFQVPNERTCHQRLLDEGSESKDEMCPFFAVSRLFETKERSS